MKTIKKEGVELNCSTRKAFLRGSSWIDGVSCRHADSQKSFTGLRLVFAQRSFASGRFPIMRVGASVFINVRRGSVGLLGMSSSGRSSRSAVLEMFVQLC
ncbi:hypothetical protein EYF80_066706 [Liparis tanakae]|uniref:Uncharacterized protein n=1 Tax=Liparis tanakae TaxID=230148 RepID=A0A4Z2E2N6_9TELE|nr:hypothetical protein EYF80_066706 [Liparis tanakae]